MFDTIVLRLYRLKKYQFIFDMLFDKKKGSESYSISLSDLERLRKNQKLELINVRHYLDTENIFEYKYRKKHSNPSSNYEFQFSYNKNQNYMQFEFSIPKYLYGTNVIQFLYNQTSTPSRPKDGNFNRNLWNSDSTDLLHLSGNIEQAYPLLMNFIYKDFFEKMFPGIVSPIFEDYKLDVQISRLDICFNQVFPTTRDMKQYLEYQKSIAKKRKADKSNYAQNYNTSVMWVGSTHSAKIYDKGAEFFKTDRKELNKINKAMMLEAKHNKDAKRFFDSSGKQVPMFDIPAIQKLADRTLRYEITAHSKFFSYLHNSKIKHLPRYHFCDKTKHYNTCVEFCIDKRKYNKLRGALDRMNNEDLSKEWHTVAAENQTFYKLMTSAMGKRYNFMLKPKEEVIAFHANTKMLYKDLQYTSYKMAEAPFTSDLVRMLCMRLKEFFNEFKVQQANDRQNVFKLFEDYNAQFKQDVNNGVVRRGAKFNLSSIRAFIEHLYVCGSWANLKDKNIYSTPQLLRMSNKCKKVGFNPKIMQGEIAQMKVCSDFSAYHDYMVLNSLSFRNHFKYMS